MRIGQSFSWTYKGVAYRSTIEQACPSCGANAIVMLTGAILAEQPDATTHVCHLVAGGCNMGFERAPEKPARRRAS